MTDQANKSQGAALGGLAGYNQFQQYDFRDQELRMRCLEAANRGPYAGTTEIIKVAKDMYEFVKAADKAPEPVKQAHGF